MSARVPTIFPVHSYAGALVAALLLALVNAGPPRVAWVADVDDALDEAAAGSRVVMLALGELGEGRTRRHEKRLYGAKTVASLLARTVNVAAWSFDGKEAKRLPEFGDMEPIQHRGNMEAVKERWITPNENDVVALPHHVWLSPAGEVLVSCPYEIDALEFAWCTIEALRLAGAEEIPELPRGARPPRRLLLGETFRTLDTDEIGRGLLPDELKAMTAELQKRFLSMRDQRAVFEIMFTDEEDAADFIEKQLGLWDLSGMAQGIVDGVVGLMGLISTSTFLDAITAEATSERAVRRAQVAVALEQLGDPDGLSTAMKAWKKEKDPSIRPEWIRAIAACGADDKGALKAVLKAAEKDKDELVRRSAILGLGHALPQERALEFLREQLAEAAPPDRDAAVLALALGRCVEARGEIAALAEGELEPESTEIVEAALSVLDGGNLYLIEDHVRRVSESELGRGRIFFRSTGSSFDGGGR